MRKWRLPLTYQPKIEPVLLGTCRQTIRPGNKKQVGDLIRFYVWSGKPYRSKQIDLTEYEPLIEVLPIKVFPKGISFPSSLGGDDHAFWDDLDGLAAFDYISPPTGTELGRVLTEINGKIPIEGIEAQILRW